MTVFVNICSAIQINIPSGLCLFVNLTESKIKLCIVHMPGIWGLTLQFSVLSKHLYKILIVYNLFPFAYSVKYILSIVWTDIPFHFSFCFDANYNNYEFYKLDEFYYCVNCLPIYLCILLFRQRYTNVQFIFRKNTLLVNVSKFCVCVC